MPPASKRCTTALCPALVLEMDAFRFHGDVNALVYLFFTSYLRNAIEVYFVKFIYKKFSRHSKETTSNEFGGMP